MVELSPHRDGVILPVRAQPGASKNGLRGEQNGMLKVSVTQIAERGKANKAIIEVLADSLDLRRSQIELLSGELQSQKRFLIRDISQQDLANSITAAISG